MLKRNYTKSAPVNRRMGHGALVAVALICGACLCWTVDADEGGRIASLVASEPSRPIGDGFQKPKLEPWQVVPAAEGYAAIRVSEMREHAHLAPLLALADQYVAQRMASSEHDAASLQELSKHGVRTQNIAAVQLNIDVTLSTRDDAKATEAGGLSNEKNVENLFSVASHQVVIDTVAPIDWRSVTQWLRSDRITERYNQFAGEAADQSQRLSTLDRMASIPSGSKRISIHTEPNAGNTIDSTIAGVWKAVDGGYMTVAIDFQNALRKVEWASNGGIVSFAHTSTARSTDDAVDAESAIIQNAVRAVEAEQQRLMEMMGHLGIGIDETSTPNELQFRLACTPVAGVSVDELESQWDRFRASAIVAFEIIKSVEEGNARYSLETMTRLLKTKCERIGGDGSAMPAGIILSGAVPLP